MRMKEDAMKNGQLKPAYNIQYGVDSEYVVMVNVGPSTTDTPTLIPFLADAERLLPFRYTNVVADAGYESEENYKWLQKHRYEAYVKPTNYEIAKTRKYRNDIGRAENMAYDAETDTYTCAEGHPLTFRETKRETTKTGYVRETRICSCADCAGCAPEAACIKGQSSVHLGKRSKNLYVSPDFVDLRQQAYERITSDFGCQLRMNRSIQVEGRFGQLKHNKSFRRFLCRSNVKVTAEMTLLAMAQNIQKLHRKIQDDRTGTRLLELSDAA